MDDFNTSGTFKRGSEEAQAEAILMVTSLMNCVKGLSSMAKQLSDVCEDLPEIISNAISSRDASGAVDFNPAWKDGTKLTPEGRQEFERLATAGVSPTKIGRRLRLSDTAVHYRLARIMVGTNQLNR